MIKLYLMLAYLVVGFVVAARKAERDILLETLTWPLYGLFGLLNLLGRVFAWTDKLLLPLHRRLAKLTRR